MRLSVIIPVYNARAFLDRCLDALRRSTFTDYECIVVDDASTDDTRAIAERHGARVLALSENGGPARARNHAARHARGEFVVFIDSDVCVHPDTLARIDAHFRDAPTADAVMGSYDDTPADPSFVSQYKNLFHHYVHQQSRTNAWTFWAGCGAVRREVFLRFGGFDESYRRPCIEDIELGFRLHAAGHRIDLDPTIQVTHLKRWTLVNLIRTDVRDRGVPWFVLMMRHRTMPPDLNVTVAHRVSVALSAVMLLLIVLSLARMLVGVAYDWSWTPVVLTASATAALLILLNREFYGFFRRKRGLPFAVATLPLHWLYYSYCGVSVLLGMGSFLWERFRGAASPVDPQAGGDNRIK